MPPSAAQIENWLTDLLVREMHVDPAKLQPDRRLALCGVDSLQTVSLVGQLETWLGCQFTSNPLDRYPTIHAISRYLAAQLAVGRTTIDPASADADAANG